MPTGTISRRTCTAALALLAWPILTACETAPRRDRTMPLPAPRAPVVEPAVTPPSAVLPLAEEPQENRDPFEGPTGTIYYVSDCRQGADPDCVPGDDQNDGRDPSAPWRTYEKARQEFARLAPGEAIAFAQGGVFHHAERYRWNNARCRADAPCFIMDYAPPGSSGDEPKPRIIGGSYGFDFSNAGDPRHHEGYVIRNLMLSSDGEPHDRRWGIFLYNDVDDVLLDAIVIEGFSIGVHLSGGKGEEVSERIVLRNSRIVDNGNQGWLGGASGVRIENNLFENNGFNASTKHAAIRHHNLYFSETSKGAVIRGNTLHRASLFDDDGRVATPPRCYGTSLVVHGHHEDLVIEDNTVYEEHAARNCYGISIDGGRGHDAFRGISIRRNRVLDVGAVAIGCTSCADVLIENNVIVQTGKTFGAHGILVPTKRRPSGDGATSDVRVRHNSLYFAGGDATAIQIGVEGEGYEIVGNAVAHAGPGRLVCYAVDTSNARYEAVDHNICHHARSEYAVWIEDRGKGFDLEAWRRRTDFDRSSALKDPHFAAPSAPTRDLALTARSLGLIDAADPAVCPPEDIQLAPRPQGRGCDIGAFEFSGGSKPARTAPPPQ